MKPIRVLLEKDGKRYGGPTTYPAGFLPPKPGEAWDDEHTVISGRVGVGDATWDEVILTLQVKPKGA